MKEVNTKQYNPALPSRIDYAKIDDALRFYERRGYEWVEVPWLVSKEAMEVTSPPGAMIFETFKGCLLASAEQSYIELMRNGALPPGKYVTCSPCFRDDELDEYHHTWFQKVELIDTRPEATTDVLADATDFYRRYAPVEQEKTSSGIDLTLGGIELGSYGARRHEDLVWTYGTGVAEPRFSHAINKVLGRGYHVRDIPKSPYGTAEKVYEEAVEFLDSIEQDNKVMSLVELSDLVGAVGGYLESQHPGISLDDLLTMDQATQRAFRSGRRQ